MPAPEWGIEHGQRLVVPYLYEPLAASTYTYRDIKDELIISDIMDADTYDRYYAQFRMTPGTADYLVGALSFPEDKVVIFNRRSIHLIGNVNFPEQAASTMVTNEVGCVARNSIQRLSNGLVFLSDNGVYQTTFQDLYNLRGRDLPLSEPIQPWIDRINWSAVDKSTSIYYRNRYYLAVPIDGSTLNNAIFVYNFLNREWESIDTFGDRGFSIDHLIEAGEEGDRRLYAISGSGAVHTMETADSDSDTLFTEVDSQATGWAVPAELHTRELILGTSDRKKFNTLEVQADSKETGAADFSIKVNVRNPDSEATLGQFSAFHGGELPVNEDATIRGRIGNRRGYGMQVVLDGFTGRPAIQNIKTTAALTFRSTNPAR
jgi:hypothetical protein